MNDRKYRKIKNVSISDQSHLKKSPAINQFKTLIFLILTKSYLEFKNHTAMKLKIIISVLLLGTQTIFLGQNLEIKPYEFISKTQDTVQAELGTFNVIEDR
jgi:hypothetical protein